MPLSLLMSLVGMSWAVGIATNLLTILYPIVTSLAKQVMFLVTFVSEATLKSLMATWLEQASQ